MNRDEKWLLEEKYGNDAEAAGFATDKRRLENGEPLAYVIGYAPFLGLTIHLDSKPLIPRPETEWWTEVLLHERPETERFLDLCAGSGAIGCAALARLPAARVSFGELESRHEDTIRKNIRLNGLDESRADLRIGDLFAPFSGETFDAIAINPPYIPEERILPESVSAFEPPEALYAGPDGLALLRRIAVELPQHLTREGAAWIECDSAHAEAAKDLFEMHGMHALIRTDQYGMPRVIVVSLV